MPGLTITTSGGGHAPPFPRALTTIVLVFTLGGCAKQPQTPSSVALISELNRSGRWGEAAQAAHQLLDADSPIPTDEKCQVYYSLAYANTRLGDQKAAREALEQVKQHCGESELPWLQAEIERLEVELGMSTALPVETHEDGFWQTADGASLGLDPQVLAQHQALCEKTGADACLVVYKGKIVQEWYSPRYYVPMHAMSSTKSVTSVLVGMLLDDGKIASIDRPVCAYIPEWCEGAKGRVTLRHLLSMTSGLAQRKEDSVGNVGDKNAFVVALPLSTEPGAQWSYSNEGVQLLSPILDRAAGEPIQDYARRRLFEPLGIMDTRLKVDQMGHAWTYADMETTPRDFARIGLLMLNRGSWGGRQIVSEGWVEQSISPSQDLNPHYGLLWWLIDDPAGCAAYGYLDTNLYVFPEIELVVARMQRNPADVPEGSYEPEALPLFERMIE
jgi:hypothetical protein